MREMWRAGGGTAEDPTPYLKTILCRLVSIAVVERSVAANSEVKLSLKSLPRDPEDAEQTAESHLLRTFLEAVGARRPQLVGYNSIASDLKILVQRGVVQGIRADQFCQRPEKPWLGVDYFARGSEYNIDLKEILGGFGRLVPSLHEVAVQSGIPGKMEVDGNQVAQLWLSGELRKIVQYNEFDALTTYLVWLRVAHFAGHFTHEEYASEQAALRELIETQMKTPENAHLEAYLREWDRLRSITAERA